jgi:hypothetical protein
MDGIGMAGADVADRILVAFLAERLFPGVSRNAALARRLPLSQPAYRALQIVIADSNSHVVQSVLHALGVLGYKRVLTMVRTAMRAGDPRTRANAVEMLSSLAHRNYVLPLLPLLEADAGDVTGDSAFDAEEIRPLLLELMTDRDPFYRAAARMAWRGEFGALPPPAIPDRSSSVRATDRALANGSEGCDNEKETTMNRLVFLKSVPLFSEMALDDLVAVDGVIARESYLPGERIVTEGDVGDKLYIIFEGEVVVRKRVSDTEERDLAHLSRGQLFGEMALFDDERRSASVVAMTDTELFALDHDHFRSLAFQRPDIPMQICKVLVARLRKANA